jgi:hypothetical protein
MRVLLYVSALAMPLIAWLSQRQVFGPDNGTLSDRYPTLLVAAGYAFSIWGLIFLLDLVFAFWLGRKTEALERPGTQAVRASSATGFALTASWMIVFSQQWFGLSLFIIWAALASLLYAALRLQRVPLTPTRRRWALVPLGLHVGWLSLAVFLNTAQVIVAYQWLPAMPMLNWTLGLWAASALLVLAANAALHGHPAYGAAVVWGLIGVYIAQSGSALPGAPVSAWVALGLMVLLLAQCAYLWRQDSQQPARRRDRVFG